MSIASAVRSRPIDVKSSTALIEVRSISSSMHGRSEDGDREDGVGRRLDRREHRHQRRRRRLRRARGAG